MLGKLCCYSVVADLNMYLKTVLPRSWESHGISGILKFSGISTKVMEFRLKLMKVMEKSWNFELMTKSHGI